MDEIKVLRAPSVNFLHGHQKVRLSLINVQSLEPKFY